MNDIELWQGDCLELMKNIPTGSVDMVLTDPPYGTNNWTKQKWDVNIDIEFVFKEFERVIKYNGAIVVFGNEPFSSFMRTINIDIYKYDIIWCKDRKTGFFNANVKPLKQHEKISVFSKGNTSPGRQNNMIYNPQGLIPVFEKRKQKKQSSYSMHGSFRKDNEFIQKYKNYPSDIIYFNFEKGEKGMHATQKPLNLIEYLVMTYSHEGDVVLDPFAGSGTTGVACKNLDRKFIGIELDENYFNIAKNRINEAGKNDE